MIASIHELSPKITISMHMTTLPLSEHDTHMWLINSTASSHLTGNSHLFHNLYDILPVTDETVSGESFTINKRGMIRIVIISDPSFDLPDVPITLMDVIYVPKLGANFLLVGCMIGSNINILSRKENLRKGKLEDFSAIHSMDASKCSHIDEGNFWCFELQRFFAGNGDQCCQRGRGLKGGDISDELSTCGVVSNEILLSTYSINGL